MAIMRHISLIRILQRPLLILKYLSILLLIAFVIKLVKISTSITSDVKEKDTVDEDSEWLLDNDALIDWFPDGIRGDNITGYPDYIVPNIVHYVLLDDWQIDFVHYVSLKSVLRHQKPNEIIIHCNCDDLEGYYWTRVKDDVKNTNTTIRVVKIEKPTHIFGVKFSEEWHNWHASDIVRNRVLMQFGGIYLDRDVYVVKSLNEFRKYEMVLDFEYNKQVMGTQVQIAHKNARFLRLYLQTYKKYEPHLWYWNAGEYPTQTIINKYPHLVHRVNYSFGVTGEMMCPMLYQRNVFNWMRDYYAIHLLIRNNNVQNWCFKNVLKWFPWPEAYFTEENVKTSKVTFGQMARLVLYNTTQIIDD